MTRSQEGHHACNKGVELSKEQHHPDTVIPPSVTLHAGKFYGSRTAFLLLTIVLSPSLVLLPGANPPCLYVKHPPWPCWNRTLKHTSSHIRGSLLSPDLFSFVYLASVCQWLQVSALSIVSIKIQRQIYSWIIIIITIVIILLLSLLLLLLLNRCSDSHNRPMQPSKKGL